MKSEEKGIARDRFRILDNDLLSGKLAAGLHSGVCGNKGLPQTSRGSPFTLGIPSQQEQTHV